MKIKIKKKSEYNLFLDSKALYYDKIDYCIIKEAWNTLKEHINLPYVIHIVGTNGKGSTGRYIASFLYQLNKNVLHYSSPHILHFNERIWINNKNSNKQELQYAHEQLQLHLNSNILNMLTYFEYTTLMALILSNDLDYIVLEAGLGGEFDATNVLVNDLSVIPSIGLDHMEFLGTTIDEIASTKLRSCNNSYILGLNVNETILNIKEKILSSKKEIILNKEIRLPDGSKKLAKYLQNNLLLAVNVIKYLGLYINDLKLVELFARFQKIQKNIYLDLGHNVLAAQAIADELQGKKIVLVYNTYKDKQYEDILYILKDNISELEIINIYDKRMLKQDILIKYCKKLNIYVKIFNYDNIEEKKDYLIFGSFKVVEEFLNLKRNNENN